MPEVEHVVVGNEPNTGFFWRPQFDASGEDAAARAYERLLAQSYDAIKAVAPHVEVIGGALAPRGADRPYGKRPTHSPTAFIQDLGKAYRASGRSRPLMDAFSMHVYGESPRVPPTHAHPLGTTIGIADYDKLVRLAPRGARPHDAHRLRRVRRQHDDSRARAQGYTGAEVTNTQSILATQARFYSQAIALAACQPLVEMLLFFHVTDEPQLENFQTGMYYADRTPKPGLEQVARDRRRGGGRDRSLPAPLGRYACASAKRPRSGSCAQLHIHSRRPL